jgi:hypothetical protein
MQQATASTFTSRHVSVSINRPLAEVYAFASNPETWPQWAAGISDSMTRVGDEWVAESPLGSVKIRFAEPNQFGILDHHVTLPDGETVYNPMRVYANHTGSELVFTIYQRPGMTDQMFAEDVQAVTRDLNALKALLER